MVISRNATIRLSQSLGNETKCEFPDMQRGQEVVVECSIEQLQGKFFVVVLNGQNLYGGVVIFQGSARKINIPVIYPLLEDGQLVLTIRPEHAIMKNYQETKPVLKSRIEISSIYDYFYEIGKIK